MRIINVYSWREEDIKILPCSIKLSLGCLYGITAVTGICRARVQFVHSKRDGRQPNGEGTAFAMRSTVGYCRST